MFKNNVYTFRNFPVEEKERKWTDCICTILAAIFALTLFISSFVIFKKCTFDIMQLTSCSPTSQLMILELPACWIKPTPRTFTSKISMISHRKNIASNNAQQLERHSGAPTRIPVQGLSAHTIRLKSSMRLEDFASLRMRPLRQNFGRIISWQISQVCWADTIRS